MSLIDDVANNQTKLFHDKQALRHSHQPDEIVGRDEETTEIVRELLDVREGQKPDTLFITGPNGVGKTVTTRHVLEKYESYEDPAKPIQTVRVNCDTINRSYYLGAKLANKLDPEANFNVHSPGVADDAVWESAFNAMEEFGGVTRVMLDEFGKVEDKGHALYQLSRAENNQLDEAVVGIVCVSTDVNITNSINHDGTDSSLSPKTIPFSRYDQPQLRELLEHRADIAFKDDVLDPAAIELAAALGAQKGGDARHALDLLSGAGNIAERKHRETIDVSCVERKDEEIERNEVFSIVTEKLDAPRRYTACALLGIHLQQARDGDRVRDHGSVNYELPRTNEIYETYKQLVDNPNSKRSVRRYLQDFDDIGLTTKEPRARSEGGDAHAVNFDLEDLHRALEEFIQTNIEPSDNMDSVRFDLNSFP